MPVTPASAITGRHVLAQPSLTGGARRPAGALGPRCFWRHEGSFLCALLTLAAANAGCAAGPLPAVSRAPSPVAAAPAVVSGVWSSIERETVDDDDGSDNGDTLIEKQEWHLTEHAGKVSGYYLATETFVSGDGRPYACSRRPELSTVKRYEVSGRVVGDAVSLVETTQIDLDADASCTSNGRDLKRYTARVAGDALVIASADDHRVLYRGGEAARQEPQPSSITREETRLEAPATVPDDSADVSGAWVWEHRSPDANGDQKIEHEEWHVQQNGRTLTGYYDRVVRQISTDGHTYRCSMAVDFQLATRYRISGEVQGDRVVIHEDAFEVLAPSACDNGQRRLDAYDGVAANDELRLAWGAAGGQVLRRPRPDVPTQRF